MQKETAHQVKAKLWLIHGISLNYRNQRYIISGEWWVALFPGAVLMLAVFCFNLLGDGLRDIMDPRMRT